MAIVAINVFSARTDFVAVKNINLNLMNDIYGHDSLALSGRYIYIPKPRAAA